MAFARHYFENVPGLGNVAVSRHAQERAAADNVSEATFADVLHHGESVPDGAGVVTRERNGVRLVILERPEPFAGAKLVKTCFRVLAQAKARR